MSIAYFAYGSNLDVGAMSGRCPDAHPERSARLAGWRLTFRGVADIEPAPDRAVHGGLWQLTEDDARALDVYEGAPIMYRRRTAEVETAEGTRPAMTYVMTDRSYMGLPSDWYLVCIQAGYADWGLPQAELFQAVEETKAELAAAGVEDYVPDGRKRLRAVAPTNRRSGFTA